MIKDEKEIIPSKSLACFCRETLC